MVGNGTACLYFHILIFKHALLVSMGWFGQCYLRIFFHGRAIPILWEMKAGQFGYNHHSFSDTTIGGAVSLNYRFTSNPRNIEDSLS